MTYEHSATEPLILLGLTLVALVVSGIGPYDRTTWYLEVAPVVIGAAILIPTYRRFPLTPLLYRLIFVHALVLILGFTYWLRVLPAFGASGVDAEFLSPAAQALDRLRHLALPLITLTLVGVGGIARYVRGSMVDVLDSPFLPVARARGLTRTQVLLRHALPNAMIPVLILLGLSLPALFSGAVFVEAIFAWPGVGRLLVEAVQARDYPVVLAATTISAGLVVLGSLVADTLVVLADPRLRVTNA